MPKFIRHRINTLAELSELSPGLGAEIDLRSHKSRVILNHEPFSDGPTFKQWIDLWVSVPNRGTLILNPKEDGLESEIIDILRAKNVEDWFFWTLPYQPWCGFHVQNGAWPFDNQALSRWSKPWPLRARLIGFGLIALKGCHLQSIWCKSWPPIFKCVWSVLSCKAIPKTESHSLSTCLQLFLPFAPNMWSFGYDLKGSS